MESPRRRIVAPSRPSVKRGRALYSRAMEDIASATSGCAACSPPSWPSPSRSISRCSIGSSCAAVERPGFWRYVSRRARRDSIADVIKLEDLRSNAAVRGLLPDCLITVVNLQWFGSEASELTYKTRGSSRTAC